MKIITAQIMLSAVVFLTGCAGRKHVHVTTFMQTEPEEAEALPPPPTQVQETPRVETPPPVVAAPEPEAKPEPALEPKRKAKPKTARRIRTRRSPPAPVVVAQQPAPAETGAKKVNGLLLVLLALMPIEAIGVVLLWKASKSEAKT